MKEREYTIEEACKILITKKDANTQYRIIGCEEIVYNKVIELEKQVEIITSKLNEIVRRIK